MPRWHIAVGTVAIAERKPGPRCARVGRARLPAVVIRPRATARPAARTVLGLLVGEAWRARALPSHEAHLEHVALRAVLRQQVQRRGADRLRDALRRPARRRDLARVQTAPTRRAPRVYALLVLRRPRGRVPDVVDRARRPTRQQARAAVADAHTPPPAARASAACLAASWRAPFAASASPGSIRASTSSSPSASSMRPALTSAS